jgi:hypothetical protein
MRHLVILAVLLPWFSAQAEEWEARGRGRGSGRYESKRNWRNVAPSLGLYGGSVLIEDSEWVSSGERVNIAGLWVGLSFLPVPGDTAVFLTVGTELNVVWKFSEPYFEPVPSLRAGVMVNGRDDVDFLPDLELYALGGYRVGNGLRDSTVRIGGGLSIPAFAVAQHYFFKRYGGIPIIPWMVEIFYDLSPQQEVGVRFGYHF